MTAKHCGLAAVILSLLAGALAYFYGGDTVSGGDQCAMFAAARFLVDSGTFYFKEFVNLQFTGNFYVVNSPELNQVYSVYPPGYSLLLAGAEILGILPTLVAPLCAALCGILMYVLARVFLPPAYALLSAAVLLSSPVLLLNAVIKNTHALGLALTLGAFTALVCLSRRPGGRGALPGAALCGLLLGYNVAVRYTEGLLLLAPVVFWLGARAWRRAGWTPRLRALAAYAAGAAVPFLFLAWYHQTAFGSPFSTGYSRFNATTGGFAPSYFFDNFPLYLPGMLNHGLGPALLTLLCLPFGWRKNRDFPGVFWLAWILPLFILYHFYFWASPDNYHLMLRFYLNFFPALVVCGLMALRRVLRRKDARAPGRPREKTVLALLAVLQVLWGVQAFTPGAEAVYSGNRKIDGQTDFLREQIPAGETVFFTSNLPRREKIDFESLFALHHCALFSSEVFALEKMRQDLLKELATEKAGAAATFQHARTTNLLAKPPAMMFAEFAGKIRERARAGGKFYYFGDVETWPEFRKTAGRYFTFGKPVTQEYSAPACLFFPQGQRALNYDPQPRESFPALIAVPLTLRPGAWGGE